MVVASVVIQQLTGLFHVNSTLAAAEHHEFSLGDLEVIVQTVFVVTAAFQKVGGGYHTGMWMCVHP